MKDILKSKILLNEIEKVLYECDEQVKDKISIPVKLLKDLVVHLESDLPSGERSEIMTHFLNGWFEEESVELYIHRYDVLGDIKSFKFRVPKNWLSDLVTSGDDPWNTLIDFLDGYTSEDSSAIYLQAILDDVIIEEVEEGYKQHKDIETKANKLARGLTQKVESTEEVKDLLTKVSKMLWLSKGISFSPEYVIQQAGQYIKDPVFKAIDVTVLNSNILISLVLATDKCNEVALCNSKGVLAYVFNPRYIFSSELGYVFFEKDSKGNIKRIG